MRFCAAASTRSLLARRRRNRGLIEREVRDHPGHGYATAARFGAAVCGSHGASAESRALRRRQAARRCGVRHPSAARGGEPAGHEPVAVCATCAAASRASTRIRAPSRMFTRTCSVKARSSARGSMRSMRSSGRSAGAFPRTGSSATIFWKAATRGPGLLSDVQLYEEYPSRYSADVSRRHRWIRGDWQIARWLLPGVPGPDAQPPEESALAAVPLEDLRQPAAQSRACGVDAPVAAGLDRVVIALVLDPGGDRDHPDSFFDCLAPGPASEAGRCALRQHLAAAARSSGRHFAQAVFTLACLPYEAFFSLDAIVRTAWRMLITHKRLLEWNPSGDSDRTSRTDLAASCRTMWIGPVVAAAAALHSDALPSRPRWLSPDPSWASGLPPPLIAWWISRPLARREARLTADQTSFSGSFPERPGRSSRHSSARKITGCRLTTIRSIPLRRSRIARRRPTWDLRCWRICPRTTSATFRPDNSSSARRRRSRPWKAWNGTGATSTTGTTPSL